MRTIVGCSTVTLLVINIILCFKLHQSHTEHLQTDIAMLQYFEVTEELLDSLSIYENDTIFNTEVGVKYLDAKFTVDSLMFNYK